MRNTRNLHRSTTAVLAVCVALVVLGGTAFAYWSATGRGSGSATTGTLNSPTGVSPLATSATSASVTWNAPTTGAAPTSYAVTRTTAAGASFCSTAVTITTTGGSCGATGLSPSTTYQVVVTSIRGNWTASAAPVSVTTPAAPVVATRPTVSITSPSAGTTGVSTSTTFSGSASDTGTVTIRLYGSSDTSTATIATATATGSVSWTSGALSTALAPGTTYYAVAEQTNAAGTGYSSVRSFTTAVAAPASPTSPTLTAPCVAWDKNASPPTATVKVSWGAGTRATSYKIYYSTSATPGAADASVPVGNVLTYDVQVPFVAGSYYFWVAASNAGGDSSKVAAGKTMTLSTSGGNNGSCTVQ